MTLITNARIITEGDIIADGWLWVDGQKIAAFGAGTPPAHDGTRIDAMGLTLAPGFVDVHVHGAVGHDTMDASADGLRAMARFYAENGVTAFLPTTWTDTRERIFAAMQTVRDVMQAGTDGARIAGVHMEGPYLNADYTGAQNPAYLRRADRDEMAALFALNVIRLIALAPEFDENGWLIEDATARGITVSAAHSAATYEQMRAAIARGIRHNTHTYNAQTGLHHRKPGIVGAVLTEPKVRAELIADTIHVHPAAMKILWLAKGATGVILITDAIRASGLPDGEYPVDDRVMVVKDGACRLADGTLAGSIIRYNDAVRNFARAVDLPLEHFWQATSLNPAQAAGIDSVTGSIAVGKDADLILIDDTCNVHLTLVQGRMVYRKDNL